MTLKTGVIMLKIQLCHHRSKVHFNIDSHRKSCNNNISEFDGIFHVFLIK